MKFFNNKYIKIDLIVLLACIIYNFIYQFILYPQAVKTLNITHVLIYVYIVKPLLYVSFSFFVTHLLRCKFKDKLNIIIDNRIRLILIIIDILLLIGCTLVLVNVFVNLHMEILNNIINNMVYYLLIGIVSELIIK